jgi:hypothetical protein
MYQCDKKAHNQLIERKFKKCGEMDWPTGPSDTNPMNYFVIPHLTVLCTCT